MKTDTLEVPGARLYYEVRGSGPVLLLIPGGPTDAGVFAGLAAALADRHTVVAYDPRGNSRSTLSELPGDDLLDLHADDAAALLALFGDEPADVMGSSGGALMGLTLAARHPKRVRTLVAHEPPVVELLPEAARQREISAEIYDTYVRHGVGPAMRRFTEVSGLGGTAEAMPAPPPEAQEVMARNLDFFLAHTWRAFDGFTPDFDALRSGGARVVVGVGEGSEGQLAHRAALALAARLGAPPVVFPGDHGGFGARPEEFADLLHQVLRGS
ncbi:alpha/beta fold hydrolase [Nonomuraea dietziae]|uniref:alpha/beta fold hydrolase n=1 Tax=Nonomuraea dietziae TaxID=65515 RepID=UPI00340F331A